MKQYYNTGWESHLSYEDRKRMRENSIRSLRDVIARKERELADAKARLAALEAEPVEEEVLE